MPTEMEDYLFDLNGYLILKNVVSKGHVAELNEVVDKYQDWCRTNGVDASTCSRRRAMIPSI